MMTNGGQKKPSPSSRDSNTAGITVAESILLLASPEDYTALSPSFCLLREQIEIFPAITEDVEARRRRGGQKDPISVGRVGLRCIHCRHIPHAQRTRGAIMYPNKMALIYQATRNFQRYHLKTCPHIPPGVIRDLGGMKRQHAANNSDRYWITSAEAKGLIDVVPPSTKKNGSGKRGAAKSPSPESGIEFRHGFDWASLCSQVLLVKKEDPHYTNEPEPTKKKSGRKRRFQEDTDACTGSATDLLSNQDGGDTRSLPPQDQVHVGDALDNFLHSLDETYTVGPSGSSNHQQHVCSGAKDSQNVSGTSITHSAATLSGSAVSTTDFEPIPLPFINESASGRIFHPDANTPTNRWQLGQFGDSQWDTRWTGDQGHPSEVPPAAAASPSLHSPPLQQQQFHQPHQHGEGGASSNNNQSELLLAEAANNIALQRELIDELSRHA